MQPLITFTQVELFLWYNLDSYLRWNDEMTQLNEWVRSGGVYPLTLAKLRKRIAQFRFHLDNIWNRSSVLIWDKIDLRSLLERSPLK